LFAGSLRQLVAPRTPGFVEEYEINTALIESLNSVEKRAAIETGQEQPDGPDRCPFDAK
jgi:hypothetical protein